MITKKNIAIIYGSTRKNRLGIRFVKYIYSQIKKRKHSPFIIDPIKDKFPLLDKRFDDFKKNTTEWKQAKGQPILYKSTPQVIAELKKIGYK